MSVACRLLFYFYEHGTLTLVKQFSSFQVEIYSQCHNSFIFVDNYYEHEFLRFFTKSFLRVYFLDIFFNLISSFLSIDYSKGENTFSRCLEIISYFFTIDIPPTSMILCNCLNTCLLYTSLKFKANCFRIS